MKLLSIKASFLSVGLLLGFTAPTHAADFTPLSSADDFYAYYGSDFSAGAKTVVEDLYSYLAPYFGANGVAQAADDGFVPMTPEARAHGTHWFRPEKIYDFTAEATRPTGLNFDENDQLVAVYWGEEKYGGILGAAQSLATLPVEALPSAYANYKATSRKAIPSILEPFGDLASWHSHENVLVENVGVKDPTTGFYDAEAISFKQSLTDEAFTAKFHEALQLDEVIIAPFEGDPTTYPPFNTAMHPGFYMAHLWVGAGNPAGAFSGEHQAISPNGIDEHLTFEEGRGGHSPTGHGTEMPGHGGTPAQSVPEPSALIGLVSLAGALSLLKKRGIWMKQVS